jgi:hypothetical protein
MAMDEVRRQSILERRKAAEDAERLEFLRTAAPEVAAEEKNRPAAAAVRNVGMKESAESETRGSMATPAAKPPREAGTRFTRQDASGAVNSLIQGTKVQVPEDKTEELTRTLYDQMMARSKADRDTFRAELETVKGRAKEIEARGIGEALAKFGFGMAAAAAKPGRRQGLAGIIESGATASPLLAESLAETQKLKAAAQDNYMKMRTENARYEAALEQGNMQLAGTLANNVSQRKLAQATLQEQIAQHERLVGLEKEKLGIMRTQAGRSGSGLELAYNILRRDPANEGKSDSDLLGLAAKQIASASTYRTDTTALIQAEKMKKELVKERGMYASSDSKFAKEKVRSIDEQIRQIDATLGGGASSGRSTSGWSAELVGGK